MTLTSVKYFSMYFFFKTSVNNEINIYFLSQRYCLASLQTILALLAYSVYKGDLWGNGLRNFVDMPMLSSNRAQWFQIYWRKTKLCSTKCGIIFLLIPSQPNISTKQCCSPDILKRFLINFMSVFWDRLPLLTIVVNRPFRIRCLSHMSSTSS